MATMLKPRDFFTLLLALLLGASAAAFSRRGGPAVSAADSAAVLSSSGQGSASAPAEPPSAARRSPEAISCASAWEALKDGKLTRDQRIQAQLALLEEWSRHDPAAALGAFFSELTSGEDGPCDLEGFDPRPAMAANPEIVEELLGSGRLGLRTKFLRIVWFNHLAKADPVGTLDRLGELPDGRRGGLFRSVAMALPSISEDPVTWQAGIDRISALIAGPTKGAVTHAIAAGLGDGNSCEDLNAAYLATADPRLKDLFARAVIDDAFYNDPFSDRSRIPAEIESLPEPFRSAVIGRWKPEPLPPPPE